jgi:hypothetical protein
MEFNEGSYIKACGTGINKEYVEGAVTYYENTSLPVIYNDRLL